MKCRIHLKIPCEIGLVVLLLVGCSPQGTSMPTGTTVPPTATALPPTQTIEPPTPTTVSAAGKTLHGPLGDGGEITFTVSADGLALDPGVKLTLKDVSCAEGGSGESGFSKLSMEITLPKNSSIPIKDMKFKYGSDNMFEPGYGMQLIGQFDSATRASGTFQYTDTGKPLEPCTYGPYQWTASTP
jgi:hypothetical protein